ncbi:MAG: hypothetical protein AB1305_01440 [Candidatus Hadarchaeota archaeon]
MKMPGWKAILVLVLVLSAAGAGAFFVTRGAPSTTTSSSPFVVSVYNPSKSYNGTTLFTDTHDRENPKIYEVDMNGNVVWEFTIPDNWTPSGTIVGFDAEVLSDNHILISISNSGVYEITRSGNLVWSKLDQKNSHDADRLSNGNTIYVFGNDDQESDAAVKEVNSSGTLVWSWYVKDNYQQRFPLAQYYNGGWAHTNAVQRLSNGNTMISMRNFYLTTIVDSNGKVVKEYDWSSFGTDVDPHEPEIHENEGFIIVCLQNDSPHVVVKAWLENGQTFWTYRNTNLRTTRDADPLPNGNVQIVAVNTEGTSSMADDVSTIIEVTPSGEIVWQLELQSTKVGQNPGFFYKAQRI